MARYRSTGHTSVDADIAFFVIEEGFQTGNIMLSNLYPRETPFEYEFTVANTDGTNIADVAMDYNMELKITTNLPLDIKIYKKGLGGTYSELTTEDDLENNIVLDESNQCYIRKINIKNKTLTFSRSQIDEYKLSATFPITYNEAEEYEGVIDNVAIILESEQKVN